MGCAPSKNETVVPTVGANKQNHSESAPPTKNRESTAPAKPHVKCEAITPDARDAENQQQTAATTQQSCLSTTSGTSISDALDLASLRQAMVSEGDIAKTVVRIEAPFGTPIEKIYQGVTDGPILGSGVSGVVRLVVHKATHTEYAVKCLDLGAVHSLEQLQALRNEISIMCQLDHPCIVRIHEVYESTNEIYIVQELCQGGDLFDRLDEQQEQADNESTVPAYCYTEAQCARLVRQMLMAIGYLHNQDIVHRDLKPGKLSV